MCVSLQRKDTNEQCIDERHLLLTVECWEYFRWKWHAVVVISWACIMAANSVVCNRHLPSISPIREVLPPLMFHEAICDLILHN